MNWQVYVLECSDGSLYTGITTDTARRFEQHQAGTAARYTRSHPPLRLIASLPVSSQSSALRIEAALKRLRPIGKRALCQRMAAGSIGESDLLAMARPRSK